MGLSARDAILIIAGIVGSLVANGLWAWWLVRSKKSREALRAEEALWRARLNHEGYAVRSEAASEILVRALYWLVLGNVLFAVTGLMTALTEIGVYELHLAVTELTFLVALAFLAISLKWLRRYLRLKDPVFGSETGGAGDAGDGDPTAPPGV